MPYYPPPAETATDSSVPTVIAAGTTFTVGSGKQALAAMVINSEGVIDVSEGTLVFVN